jgi:3-methyladenine DNA glycosylase AlkD
MSHHRKVKPLSIERVPRAESPTAAHFAILLDSYRSAEELAKNQRYFKCGPGEYAEGDIFIGVRMGQVFECAKAFIDMPPDEIETLLESPYHEVRVGAVSIMAKQAARKKTSDTRKQELYALYLRRHDRINNWDLVDLGAGDVVGDYLVGKPHDVLFEMAGATDMWKRRTAILSMMSFMPHGQLDDAYRMAELLLDDPEDLMHKAVGAVLRQAGKYDRARLLAFLDRHASRMPRVCLRTAIEHLVPAHRSTYLAR